MTEAAEATVSPDALMGELIAVTERLAELLETETALLRAERPRDLAPISVEKGKLVARYDTLTRALFRHERPALRKSPRFSALSAVLGRLNELAVENEAAVKLHINATRRVLDLIARAARNATEPRFSYGTERLGYGARSPRPTAVAVNRVL